MDSLGPRTVSSYQSDGINTRKPARSRPFCELWPVHVSPCNLALKRRGTGPRAYLLEGGGLRRRNASIVDKKTDDRRKYAFRDKHTVPIERRRSHHLESGDVTHDSAALSIRSQERCCFKFPPQFHHEPSTDSPSSFLDHNHHIILAGSVRI
jgi:hypothetical protein